MEFSGTDKRGWGVHFLIEDKKGTKSLCGAKGTQTRTRNKFYVTCADCQKIILTP